MLFKLNNIVNDFKEDRSSIDTLEDHFDNFSSLNIQLINEEITKLVKELDPLVISREAFAKGLHHYENERKAPAIDQFNKVIREDVKYDEAQSYISDIKEDLFEEIKKQSKEYYKENRFGIAFNTLKDYEKYFADREEYRKLLSKYEEKYIDMIMEETKTLRKEQNYLDAIQLLKDLRKNIGAKEEINTIIKKVEAEQEKYEKENRDKLLAKMNIQYDSFEDLTRISPKGTNVFVFDIPSNDFIFIPFIQFLGEDIDNSFPMISVLTGFTQRDWIFMDQIIFNVDGERFVWEINYRDRSTDVEFGAIYEWVVFTRNSAPLLMDTLRAISKANTVELRFSGATNFRDEKLSDKQKNQIKSIFELYDMLPNDDFLDV